jgi:hypothetical protein
MSRRTQSDAVGDQAAAASGSLPARSLIHRDQAARGVSDSSSAAVGHDLVRRDQRATHGPLGHRASLIRPAEPAPRSGRICPWAWVITNCTGSRCGARLGCFRGLREADEIRGKRGTVPDRCSDVVARHAQLPPPYPGGTSWFDHFGCWLCWQVAWRSPPRPALPPPSPYRRRQPQSRTRSTAGLPPRVRSGRPGTAGTPCSCSGPGNATSSPIPTSSAPQSTRPRPVRLQQARSQSFPGRGSRWSLACCWAWSGVWSVGVPPWPAGLLSPADACAGRLPPPNPVGPHCHCCNVWKGPGCR